VLLMLHDGFHSRTVRGDAEDRGNPLDVWCFQQCCSCGCCRLCRSCNDGSCRADCPFAGFGILRQIRPCSAAQRRGPSSCGDHHHRCQPQCEMLPWLLQRAGTRRLQEFWMRGRHSSCCKATLQVAQHEDAGDAVATAAAEDSSNAHQLQLMRQLMASSKVCLPC
jgi:hypothetical protein